MGKPLEQVANPRAITVDDREVKSGIVGLLEERGWEVRVRRLVCGDFNIGRQVLIEKKTAFDFSASILDGRLFRQVARLKRQGLRCAVLIEGSPFRTEIDIDAAAVTGAVVSVSVIWQVPVIFSESMQETADILWYAAHQVHRLTTLPFARCGYRPKRLKRRQLYILQGFEGIGPKRAVGLMKRFGTLRRVFQATPKEWTEAEGMGKEGARQIAELLDAEFEDLEVESWHSK